MSLLGHGWKESLFAELHDTFAAEVFYDEILLIALSEPDGPQVKLFELLRCSTKRARLAHRFFVAWKQQSADENFPPSSVSSKIILCADTTLQARSSCTHWGFFRFCPISLLSLLRLRLGCSITHSCCSLFCYIGCDCPDLVVGAQEQFCLTTLPTDDRYYLRTVTISATVAIGHVPIFTFHPLHTCVLFASVRDTVLGAKTFPMQLNALRASLTHRMYRYLSVRWRCSLCGENSLFSEHHATVKPDFVSAAFRPPSVASKWKILADQLRQLYAVRAANAGLSAQRASDTMAEMAKLLPFACCAAVQRLLQLPLLNVSLCTQGRFVYCLVSPFLRKLYVGAVGFKKPRTPFARFREHLNTAKMWASRTSTRRYGRRIPSLYAAIAKAGPENIIQVILADPAHEKLASTELAFIRNLSPVFNVLGASGDGSLPQAVRRLFGASVCEDVRLVGAKILRHNNPRLPIYAWPSLIACIRRTGDRELAAKVARQARQLCPKLSKLRSSPRLLFPCPIPQQLLKHLDAEIRATLRALPFVCRSLQFDLIIEAGAMGWQKTSTADSFLAPSSLPLDKVGPCQCGRQSADAPRLHGHIITRHWDALPCCSALAELGITSSFQCRTYPTVDRICEAFGRRTRRVLRTAGFSDDNLEQATSRITTVTRRLLDSWQTSLPAIMQQNYLMRIRQQVWRCGMVLARIDRNPGRLICMCRDLWMELQNTTFLQNIRYVAIDAMPSSDDSGYAEKVRDSFLSFVPGSSEWIGRKPSGPKLRPQSYWTVKQKSLIDSAKQPVVKLRPLIVHSVHPMRIPLSRVARASSILVCEARALVIARRPSHLPMWQMHAGCTDWLQRISATNGWWGTDEYDVNDCFLNTPRNEVLDAARFWIAVTAAKTRRQPCFAISKDGKKGDHRGRPASVHYWEITCEQLLLAFEWELTRNDTFEVQSGGGVVVVVQQRKGLPIGGHLSAAFVELVALRREYECSWPLMLLNCPSTRYRDNFFVVLQIEPTEAQRRATAEALSALLLMPVVFERGGRVARCLELRISWIDAAKVKATLAYRTDADRQGESQDVRTWPEWKDPRTSTVLHGLLAGLAAKLVTYSHDSIGGLPASLRQALQFLRARKYPPKAWMRPFALQLSLRGVPYTALPRALRKVLHGFESPLPTNGVNNVQE